MRELAILGQLAIDDRLIGKWVFAGVFALLIAWLLLAPAERLGEAERAAAWWRNLRVWAIAVAATQMVVYLLWS